MTWLVPADDLGLILDKTVKLEWHRANNTRIRCLRITQKVTLLHSIRCYTMPCMLAPVAHARTSQRNIASNIASNIALLH